MQHAPMPLASRALAAPFTRIRAVRNVAAVAAVLLGLVGQAHAIDDEQEREQLARIDHEIAQVQALVTRSAQSDVASQRVRFRYDWLDRDMQMVREGIRQHLDAPRQPRPVPPLRGEYRQ